MVQSEYLGKGIYTIPEAARLIGVNYTKVRGWVVGYPQTKGPPIIHNQIGEYRNKIALSFINLMEARFIAYFARFGVHVKSIRYMAEEAKRLIETPHPFATKTIFKTDTKIIYAEVAEKTGDKKLYDLKRKNWAYYEVIESSLLEGVEFNAEDVVSAWYPNPNRYPHIVIRPQIAFGQPALAEVGVPTRALLNAFDAEGETYESVAGWYEVTPDFVREAVRFEMELAGSA